MDENGEVTAVSKGTATIKASAIDDSGKYASCTVTVNRSVSSIELDNTSLTIHVGESATLTATVEPEGATNTEVTWTSSNTSVATVTSAGEVKGKAKGVATITATAKDNSGVSASCAVEVKQPVYLITLDHTDLSLNEGKSAVLMPTVLPENANDKSVTWSSSDSSVVIVDGNGKVTAVSKGTATITATANDGSGQSASCVVTVFRIEIPNAVDLGLSVKWASFNLGASLPEEYGCYYAWGETEPKNDYYVWTTYKWCEGSDISLTKYNNDSSYGIVDNKMVLDLDDDAAYVALGGNWRMPTSSEWGELRSVDNCTWEWTTLNGVNGRKVTSKKAGYTDKWIFLPAAGHLNLGLGATKLGFYWSSSLCTNIPSRASDVYFDSDGVGWGLDMRYYGYSVRPVYSIPVESISLDKTESVIWVGESMTLNATVLPSDATNKSVTWSSSNTSVATVSSSGVVTAKSVGIATVTATTNDGLKMASCAVEIRQKVTNVTFNKTSLSLNEGETSTLTATVKPDNAYDKTVVWTSSDPSVTIVDGNGNVTAVSKGTATITATANDGGGQYASCSVTVNRLVSSIELDNTALTLNVNESAALTATVLPATASNTSVTWSSSAAYMATVSSSGVVTGKYKGEAVITATAKDGSGVSASCVVEVRQPVTSIVLDQAFLSLNEGESAVLTPTVLPENANDKSVTWSSSDPSVVTVDGNGNVTAVSKGTATISAIANDGSGQSASCMVTVSVVVDLGLSVKWAPFNLGASSPEEYGDYYAWGETEPKENYNWSTYKWYNDRNSKLTKYNGDSYYGFVDNKTVLDPEDDAAHVALGSKWRMPTDAEWTELRENCSWEWTDNYYGTGVAGRIVTSNVEGYKDMSIFLPAAGNRGGTGLADAGSYGYYWSSSLCLSQHAWYVYFNSYYVDRLGYYRYYGYSVRPVYEE